MTSSLSARIGRVAPALLCLLLAVPAHAQIDRCGANVPVTRELVSRATQFQTAPLGRADAVVAAQMDSGEGVVLFVRRNGIWRGYGVAGNAGIHQLFRSTSGDVFLWAFEGMGDPPSSFRGIRVGARPGSHFCTGFDVPADLNQPEWLGEAFSFDRFNVTATGVGTVVGSSEVERAGRTETWHFRYSSRDGGRNWSRAVRARPVQALPGLYAEAGDTDERLLNDLRRSARR